MVVLILYSRPSICRIVLQSWFSCGIPSLYVSVYLVLEVAQVVAQRFVCAVAFIYLGGDGESACDVKNTILVGSVLPVGIAHEPTWSGAVLTSRKIILLAIRKDGSQSAQHTLVATTDDITDNNILP